MSSYLKQLTTGEEIFPITKDVTEIDQTRIKALWIGTAGTLNITDKGGNVQVNIPVKTGLFPLKVQSVDLGGTADQIWGIY